MKNARPNTMSNALCTVDNMLRHLNRRHSGSSHPFHILGLSKYPFLTGIFLFFAHALQVFCVHEGLLEIGATVFFLLGASEPNKKSLASDFSIAPRANGFFFLLGFFSKIFILWGFAAAFLAYCITKVRERHGPLGYSADDVDLLKILEFFLGLLCIKLIFAKPCDTLPQAFILTLESYRLIWARGQE